MGLCCSGGGGCGGQTLSAILLGSIFRSWEARQARKSWRSAESVGSGGG